VRPAHRSLGAALMRLPGQYLQSVFLPSARTFLREIDNARWALVWLQLLILIVVPVVLGLLRGFFRDTSVGNATNNVVFDILATLTVGASIASLILKLIIVPLVFFIGLTIQYLFARMFQGQGSYLAQGYTALLYQVPLSIIGGLIITFLAYKHASFLYSPLITLILFAYSLILNILAIMGVHRLSRGKAVAVVFIPYILGTLLVCGLVVAFAHWITTYLHSLH
jgi:Yip1 domain